MIPNRVTLGSFGVHFGELGGCLWELLGPVISLGKLLGFFWESFWNLWVCFWELLRILQAALGSCGECLGILGAYPACPKGGEAPVGQGRLGNTCDILVRRRQTEGERDRRDRQTDRERQTGRQTGRQINR